jgi:hypothetical protein
MSDEILVTVNRFSSSDVKMRGQADQPLSRLASTFPDSICCLDVFTAIVEKVDDASSPTPVLAQRCHEIIACRFFSSTFARAH